MKRIGLVWLVAYVGTIFAANWAVDRFGVVPVGFGLRAPAAVYVVGLAFTLRDLVQETLGLKVVILAIGVGAALSAVVSPTLAFASATAFLVSESLDLSVYTPLRERTRLGAILVSNVAGLTVDSAVFLWLAFGSLEFFWGQVVGKLVVTLATLGIIVAVRTFRR